MAKKIEEEPFDEETEDTPEDITDEDETSEEKERLEKERRKLRKKEIRSVLLGKLINRSMSRQKHRRKTNSLFSAITRLLTSPTKHSATNDRYLQHITALVYTQPMQ